MTVFCHKKMNAVVRLGERFRAKRTEKEWDILQASLATHIPAKYLEAIETSAFDKLPKAKAYRVAYIKEYAEALGLPTDSCTQQFQCEEGLENTDIVHPRTSLKWLPFTSISIFARNIVIACLILLFAGYLGWQVNGILQPPTLVVSSPAEGHVFNQPVALVAGATEKEAILTVNGEEVMVDDQGNFSTKIDLSNGVNTIIIEATKKHGKTSVITRHLVVEDTKVSIAQ